MPVKKSLISRLFPFCWRDFLVTMGILLCAVEVCILLRMADSSDGFASPVFVLAVLMISRLTTGYLFGLIASLLGVICVNFIFINIKSKPPAYFRWWFTVFFNLPLR